MSPFGPALAGERRDKEKEQRHTGQHGGIHGRKAVKNPRERQSHAERDQQTDCNPDE